MKVFVVQHVHECEDGSEDEKLIGVYSTEQTARDAVGRLSQQPGFRDSPQDFFVDPYELDEDHWPDGFVTVRPDAEDVP